MRISDWSSDVCSSDLDPSRTGPEQCLVPPPVICQSRKKRLPTSLSRARPRAAHHAQHGRRTGGAYFQEVATSERKCQRVIHKELERRRTPAEWWRHHRYRLERRTSQPEAAARAQGGTRRRRWAREVRQA